MSNPEPKELDSPVSVGLEHVGNCVFFRFHG